MFDFKSLLNDMEQSRRRSFISIGVVCFFALALIIGLGIFSSTSQLRQQPSASPTMTGRELFNKVVEQEKAALEKQAQLEAGQAPNSSTVTVATQTSNSSAKDKTESKSSSHQAPQKEATKTTATAKITTVSQSTSQTTEKDNPYFSILHEPWPPSSAEGTTKVESTFVPRLGSMFLMLCITCTIIWLSLKIFAPLFNKFTGASTAPQNHLQIIEKKALAPNKAIVLIETHGQHILLGMTDQSITTLASFDLVSSERISPTKPSAAQEVATEPPDYSDIQSSEPQQNQDAADSALESQGKNKNLLKEVISQHFSSLPLPKINK